MQWPVRRSQLQSSWQHGRNPHGSMEGVPGSKVQDELIAIAARALRGLVDAIVLAPDQGGETLQIDLRGNLAAMLGATVQTKRSPESDDLSLQVSLVAGARNKLYRRLCWTAA